MTSNDDLHQDEMDALLGDFPFHWEEDDLNGLSGYVDEETGAFVISVEGRTLLGPSAGALISSLDALTADVDRPVIVDLRGCSFLSSIALGFLANLALDRSEAGQPVVLCGANGQIRKVLTILRLSTIFRLTDSLEEARRAATCEPPEPFWQSDTIPPKT